MIGTRRVSAAKSKSLFALLAVVAALAATCSKAPAAAALEAADHAVASARTEGERFAPEQLTALRDAARSAHDEFDRGDYAAAKASADAVVAEAQNVEKAAAAKKEEVTRAWGDLKTQVPAMGDTVHARVDELAAMRGRFYWNTPRRTARPETAPPGKNTKLGRRAPQRVQAATVGYSQPWPRSTPISARANAHGRPWSGSSTHAAASWRWPQFSSR
jgi:hypothetical protein